MGHPRRAKDAPSPVELLAIFQAKESGIPLPEISRRTKYAVSSIIRWWEKWGADTAFFEAVSCEVPDLAKEHSFDVLYPDLDRQGTFEGCGPVEIEADFSRPLVSPGIFADDEPSTDPEFIMKAFSSFEPYGPSDTPTQLPQGQSPDEWDE